MKRRTFFKQVGGYSLALAAGGVILPRRAKCEIIKPFAEILRDRYLDKEIRKKIYAIKNHNPNLSLGEIHCHSYFSDGNYSVKDLMVRSASLGLDFLVITEHLTPRWYKLENSLESIKTRQKVFEEWDNNNLKAPTVYPAFEISTKEGHLIAIFPKEYFKSELLRDIKRHFARFDRYEIPVELTANLIRKMGGVSIVSHPNISRSYPFGISTDFIHKNLVGLVDGIEDISTGHDYSKEYSKEIGLASIGSSDDHLNILIGTTVTQFDRSEQNDLIEAIRNHKTQAIKITDSLSHLFSPTKFFFSI